MIKIKKFKITDLEKLNVQEGQRGTIAYMDEDILAIEDNHLAISCFDGEEYLCSGGLLIASDSKAFLWSVIDKNVDAKRFYKIHKIAQRLLESHSQIDRIEAVVDNEFEQGHRWIRLLGFSREGTMRRYYPDGQNADLYAKVRMF